MQKLAGALLVLTTLVAGASASTDKPFHVELGAYVPHETGSIHESLGGAIGLGYRFAKYEDFDFGVAARGNFFHANQNGIGGDVSQSSELLTATWRPHAMRFFVGAGAGIGQADVRAGGINWESDTKFVYSLDLGYEFSGQTYVFARYQGSDWDGQRGATVGVGFRF